MTPSTQLIKTLAAIVLLFALAPVSAMAQSGGGFDLTWSTIDGGGGFSAAGAFQASGTVGQPDAGTLAGGFIDLGGYWVGDPVNSCKPNRMTQSNCLGTPDLLTYLNLYFIDYDGFGSAVPAYVTLPAPVAPGTLYAVPCTSAQQSVVPPVVPPEGLKADYDADCQVGPADLLWFLSDYFNPIPSCFSGC